MCIVLWSGQGLLWGAGAVPRHSGEAGMARDQEWTQDWEGDYLYMLLKNKGWETGVCGVNHDGWVEISEITVIS